MRPHLYRLAVDWAGSTNPDGTVDLAKPNPGCMRDKQPCAPYAGVKAQFEAIAAAQKEHPGRFEVLLVLTGTPEGLARPPGGCERAGIAPRSRPPRDEAVPVYADFIGKLQDLARTTKAQIRYWSPWNEPNHPYFFSPQRSSCSAKSENASIEPYELLAEAMADRLADGEELVLGELAGLLKRKPGYTGVREFISKMSSDLVCSVRIWTQHGYVGGPDPMDDVDRALRTHGCDTSHALWVTETGVGAPRRGEQAKTSAKALLRACRLIRGRLNDWFEDPRIDAAFQYTLREDDRFPTGLVTTDLSKAFPALDEWIAWSGDRDPVEEPPASTCAA